MWISRALALTLVAAGWAAAPAQAAGETCRGQAATIVGDQAGTPITGTDGADVIVTNGEADVDSRGGDDVICVTDVPAYGVVRVQADVGADVLDTTGVVATEAAVAVVLGPGPDRFFGGPQVDAVFAGVDDGADRDRDRIVTGAGMDTVHTGEAGRLDADDVDLGPGRGYLHLASDRVSGTLRAAPGAEASVDLSLQRSGRWVLDDRADRATLGGRTMSAWSHFHVAEVHGSQGVRIRYLGSDRPDRPSIFGHVTGVDLRGGNDDVALYDFPRLRGTYVGGRGADRVRFQRGDELVADLGRGRLGTEIGHPTATISGFERLEALDFDTVWLVGSRAANRLTFSACEGSANGGPGDDRITALGRGSGCGSGGHALRQHGGPGDDTLYGSQLADTLLGGPGDDVAYGRDGSDFCNAEREVDCER